MGRTPESSATPALFIFPVRRLAWRGRSVAEPTRGRESVVGRAERARKGLEGAAMREAAAVEKRGGASATTGSTNPGGMSVSAFGRAWAAGAREMGCMAFRRKGRSRKAPGGKREPPPISEERPNDSTDTYNPARRFCRPSNGRQISNLGPTGVHANVYLA